MSKKYIELKKENLIFEGKTEKEKKINETIFDLCLENDALYEENKELKEQYSKLEDKYIKNLPCCNEKDCDLFKEYKQLKQQLFSSDQTEITCSKCNEKITVNYSRQVYELKHILTEFEKWLEKEINNRKIHYEEPLNGIPMTIIDTLKFCLDKLQELKEGKK